MKIILSAVALISVSAFASPAFACEMHQSHAAVKTVEAAKVPPVVVVEPSAMPAAATEEKAKAAPMSTPMGAAYEGCHRMRKDQTVYLTH